MFAKCFDRIIWQCVPEGSGSWEYNHYFPVAEGEGKELKNSNCDKTLIVRKKTEKLKM